MPAYKIFWNWDNRKFYDFFGNELAQMAGKNKTIRTYELGILQDDQTVRLPSATVIKAAVKKPADPPGTTISVATATQNGWAGGMRWYFNLDLTDSSIDALFTGQTVTYNAQFEIYIELPDGQQLASISVPFTIEKNVVKAAGP